MKPEPKPGVLDITPYVGGRAAAPGAVIEKVAAMEADLRGMFHDIEATPVPNRLTMVVDALEEGEALTPTRAAARDPKSTVRS